MGDCCAAPTAAAGAGCSAPCCCQIGRAVLSGTNTSSQAAVCPTLITVPAAVSSCGSATQPEPPAGCVHHSACTLGRRCPACRLSGTCHAHPHPVHTPAHLCVQLWAGTCRPHLPSTLPYFKQPAWECPLPTSHMPPRTIFTQLPPLTPPPPFADSTQEKKLDLEARYAAVGTELQREQLRCAALRHANSILELVLTVREESLEALRSAQVRFRARACVGGGVRRVCGHVWIRVMLNVREESLEALRCAQVCVLVGWVGGLMVGWWVGAAWVW